MQNINLAQFKEKKFQNEKNITRTGTTHMKPHINKLSYC